MAVSSLSLGWTSSTLSNKLNVPHSYEFHRSSAYPLHNTITCSRETSCSEESYCNRRPLLLGVGALSVSLSPASSLFAQEIPDNYQVFVNFSDGYSYVYPSDWTVFSNLVRHVYSAPTQRATIFDMQERTVDGKNYYTFEYELTSSNFSRTAFATIAIANGTYYTLTVGANKRRWRRVRNKLKVVADSFKVLDI